MLLTHIVVGLLLTAFPIWDIWETRRLHDRPDGGTRKASYLRLIAVLWATTFLILLNHPIAELLSAPDEPTFRLPVPVVNAITIGLLAVLLLPIGAALVHAPTQARLRTAADDMAYLMPQGRMEALLFAGVAVSAGICEELIFRGFLLRYLLAEPFGFSPILSLIISALFFGFGHAGQGSRGILVTGASGFFFGWLYLASGSLLLPMVLHIIVDLRVVAIAYITRNFSARLPL